MEYWFKITAILLNSQILPIGGASAVEGLRLMGLLRLVYMTMGMSLFTPKIKSYSLILKKKKSKKIYIMKNPDFTLKFSLYALKKYKVPLTIFV